MYIMASMIASALAPIILKEVLGYEKGGKVKKTGLANLHEGEFVLPKGVAPTVAQRRAVAKRQTRPKQTPARKPAARKPRVRKPTNNLIRKGKGRK